MILENIHLSQVSKYFKKPCFDSSIFILFMLSPFSSVLLRNNAVAFTLFGLLIVIFSLKRKQGLSTHT